MSAPPWIEGWIIQYKNSIPRSGGLLQGSLDQSQFVRVIWFGLTFLRKGGLKV